MMKHDFCFGKLSFIRFYAVVLIILCTAPHCAAIAVECQRVDGVLQWRIACKPNGSKLNNPPSPITSQEKHQTQRCHWFCSLLSSVDGCVLSFYCAYTCERYQLPYLTLYNKTNEHISLIIEQFLYIALDRGVVAKRSPLYRGWSSGAFFPTLFGDW